MYANLAKGQAFPLAIRVCSRRKSFHTSKFQSLQIGSHPKPPINLSPIKLTKPSSGFGEKKHLGCHIWFGFRPVRIVRFWKR
ncbi:hypothetical protein TB2_025935 [Malus domestica]